MPGRDDVSFQFADRTIELKLTSSQILQFGGSVVVAGEVEELHEEGDIVQSKFHKGSADLKEVRASKDPQSVTFAKKCLQK